MQKEAAGFPKEDTPDNGGTRTAAVQRLDNLRIAGALRGTHAAAAGYTERSNERQGEK